MKFVSFASVFALIASAILAAPESFVFDDITFNRAHTEETPVSRIYGYVPEGQTFATSNVVYTIIVLKSDKTPVAQWYKDVIKSFEEQPLAKILNRDDENNRFAVMTVSPDAMVYNYWRYGTDAHGQAIANGIAWNFSGDKGREEYSKFVEGKVDEYYTVLLNQDLLTFGPKEKTKKR